MIERLSVETTFESAIATMLKDLVALEGAEYGDVQLLVGDELLLVAQIGLAAAFIKTFLRVRAIDGCACGRALREHKTIILPDVECDAEYAGFLGDARSAGYRGVQSTPFYTGAKCVGVVSTLFANPHQPTDIEIGTFESYVTFAGSYLSYLLGARSIGEVALQMHSSLCAEFNLSPEVASS